MSLFGGGSNSGQPKVHPSKAPDAPSRRTKAIQDPARKRTKQASHGSSTLTNLMSARADGVVGAKSPSKSYSTRLMAAGTSGPSVPKTSGGY